MKTPPDKIDNAEVLEWAWSTSPPFAVIRYSSGEIAAHIHGLALCKAPKSHKIYRFSCDADWQTEQDAVYNSLSEAKAQLPDQYLRELVKWQKV